MAVTVRVPARSWRGQGMSVHLASGDLTVRSQVMFRPDITLPLDEMLATIEALPLRGGDGDDWLRMAGLHLSRYLPDVHVKTSTVLF